jgi:septal ring factor EnvC (AmiA/AmiB activator)
MKAHGDADTWHLATAPVEIISDRRARVALRSVLVAVLVCLAVLAGMRLYAGAAGPVARAESLRSQNTALAAEMARLRAELELERATRRALEEQLAALHERSSELESRLNFFTAQTGRGAPARSQP